MKTYRNPERQKPEEYKPYVPQYKEMNIAPINSSLSTTFVAPTVIKKDFPKPKVIIDDLEDEIKEEQPNNLLENLLNLEGDKYLLIVSGVSISSGSLPEIQDEANKLVFGEHPDFLDQDIDSDDIVIFKKIKLKVGVFLE